MQKIPTSSDSAEALRPPEASWLSKLIGWGIFLGVCALLVVSFRSAHMGDLPSLFTKFHRTQVYMADFLQPDFSDLKLYIKQMWVTIAVAVWGTLLSLVFAIPLSLLSANNVAPVFIVQPIRRVMDLLRSVNELVMGTAFLVAVGISPLAGVLALALHNAAVLTKLFSEAVEAIDVAPVEGVRATGAGRLSEVVWGIIPQVGPLWTSFALYRFESNTRSATVLGLIGAGGIGQVLFENLNSTAYHEVGAISIVIVIAVTLIDLLSSQIRKRLL